jgi:glutamate-1-semialdehyde 2,1-aminomutase
MSEIETYLKRTSASRKLYERACKVFPSGNTRAPHFMWPYPAYITRAEGCRIWDADGNEYIDYVNNYGPLILGHRHPKVLQAVKEQLENGFWMGGASELEIKLAERMIELYPSIEQLRYCPTGSEACMTAARAVRAYTGKDKILALEGGFHGSLDPLYTTAGGVKGLTEKVPRVPFNNAEAMEKAVKNLKDEIAAVFIEPVLGAAGGLPPKEDYLKAVREITEDNDVLLVFDEVVTGFRIAPGGAAERFGAKPDVAIFGKIVGGGFSGAAIGGSKEIMGLFAYPITNSLEVVNPPIRHPGTYNDHKISMVAGLANLTELSKPGVYDHLEKIGQGIRSGLKQTCTELGIKAQVTGIQSLFHLHFTDKEINDIVSARRDNQLLIRLYDICMANRGINVGKAHVGFCSTPTTDEDVKETISAMKSALTTMKPIIREVAPNLIEY